MKPLSNFIALFFATMCMRLLPAQPLQLDKVLNVTDHYFSIQVKPENSGQLLVNGRVTGTLDLDPGPDSIIYTSQQFSDDFYLQKLNAEGNSIWTRAFGNNGNERSWFTAEDELGNIYLTATFRGDLDADPGPDTFMVHSHVNPNNGVIYIDFLVIKLDKDGNFIWAKNYDSWAGSVVYPGINQIIYDGSGHIYLAGNFGNDYPAVLPSETFGISHGDQDVFIMKIDTDGNTLWIKTMGGTGLDQGYGLVLTPENDLIFTGVYHNSVDFDPGTGNMTLTAATGTSQMFILKLDSDGNFKWVKSTEGGILTYNKVALDNTGNIYIAGSFRGTVDFNPGTAVNNLQMPNNTQGSFVLKLDNSGNYLWAKSYRSVGPLLQVDKDNNLLIGGSFTGSVDFDPSFLNISVAESVGGDDVYITKLNAEGIFQWVVTWGSPASDYPRAIWLDSNDDLVLHASFDGSADIDPGPGETTVNNAYNLLLYFHDSTTPVFENNTLDIVRLFPNPTSGIATVQLPANAGPVYAELTDMDGKVLITHTFTNNASQQIQFEGPAGIYLLHLNDNMGHQFITKVVKK